ncbi:MAG TPA: hypothetical protein VF491_12785, partial [Vicinamibacterales bacterium]
LSLVTMHHNGAPNVAVRSVTLGSGHLAAAGTARVELARAGAVTRTQVEVRDGAAVVGTAVHDWKTENSATIDVPWWPVEPGARTLRIEATPIEGETVVDNTIDAGVVVTASRAPVLVFDTRPSWSSTFVRRALEDNPAFAVSYRTRLAPSLAAGTANGALDSRSLDLASVVVIGGPDALSVADVTLLEHFVRVRGGTLVLLPEHREAGEAARVFGGPWSEHLGAAAEPVGPLQATEILKATAVPITSTILARAGDAASIVATPVGNGRIIVSGAMDAWRYRDRDAGTFDRFWRSLVAEGATAGEAVQLRFDRALQASGSHARFTLTDRRMDPPASSGASAVMRCESGEATAVRLWPSGTLGEFAGEIPVAAPGSCSVEATIAERRVTGFVSVADQPMRGVDRTLASLSDRVAAAGGAVASLEDVSAIARTVATSVETMSPVVTVYPMRAWWWMLPFAGCLSVEWWLRRRSGLR